MKKSLNILVESGSYKYHNFGDVAMLQSTVILLKKFFDADIKLITEQPELVPKLFYDIKPFHIKKPDPRLRILGKLFPNFLFKIFPLKYQIYMEGAEVFFYKIMPEFLGKIAGKISGGVKTYKNSILYKTIIEADLVILCGAGLFTDAFYKSANRAIITLFTAAEHGVPIAIVGQGIGPIHNNKLLKRFNKLVDKLDLIGLREKKYGLFYLNGNDKNKVKITGDDAIRLSYPERNEEIGDGIGINVRQAFYSGFDDNLLKKLKKHVKYAVQKYDADLISLPILTTTAHSDMKVVRQMFGDYEKFIDADLDISEMKSLIKRFNRCRVVITGSYHAGVFALSQGIPIVALAKSEYYKFKFEGLASMFPGGCEVIRLYENESLNDFDAVVKTAWDKAPLVKNDLIKLAEKQIEKSESAYQEISEIVNSKIET